MNLADLPLVCVLWLDAHDGKEGEYTKAEILKDYHEPAVIRTFGLLLIDDEKGITLVKEITTEEDEEGETTYRGRGFIPRGMVKELISLGIPKRPRKKTLRTPSPTKRLKGEVPPLTQEGEEVTTINHNDEPTPTN